MGKFYVILFVVMCTFAKDLSGLKRYESHIKQTISELNSSVQKRLLQSALDGVKSSKIVKGSCWDYINALYNENNITKEKRVVIFKSSKKGPFAQRNLFKSGDWVYHINHSYHNVSHSGMFIDWVDKKNFKALMLSYAGENKKTPARFRVYTIDNSYNIMRPKGEKMQGYIPLKEYAIKNKISIFNAMKLVRAHKLEYITKTIDGKEKIFIKEDSKIEQQQESKKMPTIEDLIKEIEQLKKRVEALEQKINK